MQASHRCAFRFAAVFASSAMLIGMQTFSAFAEDLSRLDERIAVLKQENAALRKQAQIQALEKENAALRRQIGVTPVNEPRKQLLRRASRSQSDAFLTSTTISSPGHAHEAPNEAMAVASSSSWAGLSIGASFGIGRLSSQESDNANSVATIIGDGFSQTDQISTVANVGGHQFGGLADLT